MSKLTTATLVKFLNGNEGAPVTLDGEKRTLTEINKTVIERFMNGRLIDHPNADGSYTYSEIIRCTLCDRRINWDTVSWIATGDRGTCSHIPSN